MKCLKPYHLKVEQVFDAISYCKGSTVVNMVLAFLGALLQYLSKTLSSMLLKYLKPSSHIHINLIHFRTC